MTCRTFNDPGENMNFINGTGAVDIYGLDEYPNRFNCSDPTHWQPVMTNYHAYHESVDPGKVFYMPEFQGAQRSVHRGEKLIYASEQVAPSIPGADQAIMHARR